MHFLNNKGHLLFLTCFKSDKENLASDKPSGAGGRLSYTDALSMDGRVSL